MALIDNSVRALERVGPVDLAPFSVRIVPRSDAMATTPYIPEEDVFEERPDGRRIKIAAAGVPMPYARAVQLGLIKPTKGTGPTEIKSQPELDQLQAEHDAEQAALNAQLADQETERVNAQAAEAMQASTGDPHAQAPSVEQAEQEQAERDAVAGKGSRKR